MKTMSFQNAHFQIFSVGPLIVSRYRVAPDVNDVVKHEAVLEAAIRQYGKVSTLMVIDSDNPKVDAEPRARIAQMLKKVDAGLLGTATVILMPGLQGTIVRTFLSGVNALARVRAPSKVFATPEQSKDWLCALPGQPANIHALFAEALAELPTPSHARAA
jgi:hypothetical protein